MSDIKCCPFCGSNEIVFDDISVKIGDSRCGNDPDNPDWRGLCTACGCIPEGECATEEKAKEQWNDRYPKKEGGRG